MDNAKADRHEAVRSAEDRIAGLTVDWNAEKQGLLAKLEEVSLRLEEQEIDNDRLMQELTAQKSDWHTKAALR